MPVKFNTKALLSGLLTMSMVACVNAKPLTIGMSFQELNNEYFVTMKESLEQSAKDINATVYTADAAHDVSKQISDVEDMLQKKIDILLINPADSVGAETAVLAAKKAGVVVVAIDAQANGPIDSFVGSKNYDAGFIAGEHLAKALGDKGNVAILDGIPVVPILERVRGFEDAMKKHPNIKVLTKLNGKQERDTSMSVTENMLQSTRRSTVFSASMMLAHSVPWRLFSHLDAMSSWSASMDLRKRWLKLPKVIRRLLLPQHSSRAISCVLA